MRRISHLALPMLLLVTMLVVAPPAPTPAAAVVKCTAEDTTADGRVFPEGNRNNAYLRFQDMECGVKLLDELFPGLVEITIVGTSRGGHPIYDVLLTDESVAGPKEKLLVVNSIHGNEHGAREGGARVIEDMVNPDYLGDEEFVQKVLDQYVVHFLFPNPDGWVAGEPEEGGSAWTRGNDSGLDLNRNFPVQGYISAANGTLEEPESQGIIADMFDERGWFLGTDNHGQGPDTYAAAGLQIVGQFDYQKSETLARFADGIDEAMAEYDVLSDLEALREGTGQDLGSYHWGTLYDMLGYSASGSLIDYYNTVDGVSGTGFATELTAGSSANYLTYSPLNNQVWIDSIRAINYTMFKQAVDRKDFTYEVGGRAAYVFDPAVVTHDDTNGVVHVPDAAAGEDFAQQPYSATRMTFFQDLNKDADKPLTKITVAEVLNGDVDLRQFDSVVLADAVTPGGGDEAAWLAALKAYGESGGNVIVTDTAAKALTGLLGVPAADVTMTPHYVGFVDFGDRNLPLNANLRGVASQTYDTVPIGFSFGGANAAPNWKVTSAAWTTAKGTTAGTNGSGLTIYGEAPLGQGKVRFLGALLPQPTEAFYHPFGLQDYAVTYTGYTLLQNMLKYTNPNRIEPPAPPVDPTDPPPPIDPTDPPPPVEPPDEAPEVERVSGEDRIATAAAVSQASFDPGLESVFIATGTNFPDALAGVPAAARERAPVLLVERDRLPAPTRAELKRLSPARIVVMGGTAAVSAEVVTLLEEIAPVERRGGAERFATAALVSAGTFAPEVPVAYVATGRAFPDALSGGAAAAAEGGPMLLVEPDAIPADTMAELRRLAPARIVVLGGTGAVSEAVAEQLADVAPVQRVAGSDRFATASAVSAASNPDGARTAYVATGEGFADALVAGSPAGLAGAPVLLVQRDYVPASTAAELDRLNVDSVVVVGGSAAISDAVVAQLREP